MKLKCLPWWLWVRIKFWNSILWVITNFHTDMFILHTCCMRVLGVYRTWSTAKTQADSSCCSSNSEPKCIWKWSWYRSKCCAGWRGGFCFTRGAYENRMAKMLKQPPEIRTLQNGNVNVSNLPPEMTSNYKTPNQVQSYADISILLSCMQVIKIADVSDFKKRHSLFPAIKPYVATSL